MNKPVKFLLTMDYELRKKVKRMSKRHDVSMNEFITTVVREFISLQEKDKQNEMVRKD